jgi:hypothetical protein
VLNAARRRCAKRAAAAVAIGILAPAVHAADDAANMDPIALLKLDGKSGGALGGLSSCSPAVLSTRYNGSVQQALNDKFDRIGGMMTKKDYLSAAGEGKTDASIFSYCFTKYGKDADAPVYAAGVGHFLTVAAVASHNAQMDSPEILEGRKRAKALLTYAKSGGQDTAEDLAALALLEPKKEETVTSGDFQKTARESVGSFEANQFGFDRAYLGKTLQITGPSSSITPTTDGAVLKLVGIPRDRDHQGLQDFVSCWIKDKDSLDKAASVSIPQDVIVAGKYEHVGFNAGIQLTGCTVVAILPKKPAGQK